MKNNKTINITIAKNIQTTFTNPTKSEITLLDHELLSFDTLVFTSSGILSTHQYINTCS
jgi:hypothetical protein